MGGGGAGGGGAGAGLGGAGEVVGSEGSLEESIPGIPGEDYPIYATVPDTGFSCDGQAGESISRLRVGSMQTRLQNARRSISVPWETLMAV